MSKPKSKRHGSHPSALLAPVEGLPALLARVEHQYERLGTMTASFRQSVVSASGTFSKKPKESSGTIKVRYPDQFRWETIKPDPTLVVSDGKSFWQYTPPFDSSEPGQVIEGSARRFRNTLAGALLAGNFRSLVPIRDLGDERYEVLPKRGTAGAVKRVEFTVDPQQLVMTGLTLIHADGTTTSIELSDIKAGATVEDREFQFVVPPNTDRIKAK